MAEDEKNEIPDKPSIVVSGDTFDIPADKDLTVGPGLVFRNNSVTCTKPGVIKSNDKSVWIDRNNRRFVLLMCCKCRIFNTPLFRQEIQVYVFYGRLI